MPLELQETNILAGVHVVSRLFLAMLAGGGLLLGFAPHGAADDAAAEIAALKAQVEALVQRVEQLEDQLSEQREAPSPPLPAPPAPTPSPGARISADADGFTIASPDNNYRLRISGQFGYDYAWFRQDRTLERVFGTDLDGVGFRFIRLRLSGILGPPVGYSIQLDFAGDAGDEVPTLKDVWVEYRDIPFLGDSAVAIRAGHFREPFGHEILVGVDQTQFLERSLVSVFAPSRNPGIMLHGAALGAPGAERLAFALGAFKEADDWPGRGDARPGQGHQFTGRVTGLPYYADDGARLLHLGLAHSVRDPDGDSLRFGIRPEARLSSFRYIDTDRLAEGFRLRDAAARRIYLTGLELAAVRGPFSFQGEYHHAAVRTRRGSLNLGGYYLQAAYVLTGEHRPYSHATGVLQGIDPEGRFSFRHGGAGSWEVAARWSSVDLDDRWLRAGRHEALTLGVNWYLNPNARIMANWSRNWIDHWRYKGHFDAYQTRFQVSF